MISIDDFFDAPAKISKQGCGYESGCVRDKSQKLFLFRQDRQSAASLLYNFLNADY